MYGGLDSHVLRLRVCTRSATHGHKCREDACKFYTRRYTLRACCEQLIARAIDFAEFFSKGVAFHRATTCLQDRRPTDGLESE